MDETEKQPLITCTLTIEADGEKQDHVTAVLWEDKLTFGSAGNHGELRLSTFFGVRANNYRILINAPEGEIVLSMIGHLYEDFARRLIRAYHEVLFSESLMKEPVHFETDGNYSSSDGETSRAALRICETALVILPETHDLIRIPFCMIAQTDNQPYKFSITDRLGRTHILSKMGFSTDSFMHAYLTRLAELIQQTREKLNEIAPADDCLAMLLMEGLVQPLTDISNASEKFSDTLTQGLATSQIASEYAYLSSISNDLAIGVKRGLMGELTGESMIILAPVFDKNVLIMESLGDTSAATYIFRLSGSGTADKTQWRRFLLEFNDSMLNVNFRREPIYLSDEALTEARYEIYANTLRRVPALARLRALFIGRAVHTGFDAWKSKIQSYMQ